MQVFKVADGGNPDGTAKDRVGLTAGTTYLSKYWNDNFFNIFNVVTNTGYTLIDDDLEQLTKALKGKYQATYTYNTSSIATQSVNDVVLGSDGLLYEVQANAVIGDDPVGSVTGNWKAYKPEWLSREGKATTITPSADADYTLTADQNTYGRLKLVNGSWTSAHNIIVDNTERSFLVDASGLTVNATVKTSAGTGIAVAAGTKVWLLCDGTNMVESINTSILSGFKNLIINGNPIVNQRGYVSATATTGANEYTLDRWRVVTSGQALTFSTTANVTTMTLPSGGVEQVIEGLNFQSGTYTISFVATGDTICTVNGATKASGDTFTLTGGTNATVKFSSASGTGTVKLIQVEQGSVATPFEQRPYGLELSLCQRYYEECSLLGVVRKYAGTSISNYDAGGVDYKQEKRVIPTIVTSTPSYTSCSSLYNELNDVNKAQFTITASGALFYSVAFTFNADAEL